MATGQITIVPVQYDDQGFVNNTFYAYSNLTRYPVALALFAISTIGLVAETNNASGPLELFQKTLQEYISVSHPAILVTLATLVLSFLTFVIKFKVKFFLVTLVAVIPMTYSEINALVTIFLIFYVLVSAHSVVVLYFFIQTVFIYYFLTSTADRLLIVVVSLFLVFGVDNLTEMLGTTSEKDSVAP